VFNEPELDMSETVTKVGVWSNVVGVKLFRGIDGGGVVPTAATVTSGRTIFKIVPGVEALIPPEFAGMN